MFFKFVAEIKIIQKWESRVAIRSFVAIFF